MRLTKEICRPTYSKRIFKDQLKLCDLNEHLTASNDIK